MEIVKKGKVTFLKQSFFPELTYSDVKALE